MKRAPVVSPDLEASLMKLAAHLGKKGHVNVVSETEQLHVHVFVDSGRIMSWDIHDYMYSVGFMAEKLNERWDKRLSRYPVRLYAWDGTLVRQKLGREIGPATEPTLSSKNAETRQAIGDLS